MSELRNRSGVAITELAVNKMSWFFREQPISDQGVDAIVEDVAVTGTGTKRKEEGTGRLLGLQIKASVPGSVSYFAEPSPKGWWFRFSADHARRWLNLAIPLVVVLVDVEAEVGYWQEVSPRTIVKAGKRFKVEVPAVQTLDTAAEMWRVLSSKAAAEASTRYENSIAHLPSTVGKLLKKLDSQSSLDAPLIAYHLAEGRHNPEDTVQALLTAEPIWVVRQAAKAWRVVAEYAGNYDCDELAAEAYQRAATATPDSEQADRARWLVSAAIHLTSTDRDTAAKLVDDAEAANAASHLIAVLRAVLAHPLDDARPIDLPDSLDIDSEAVRKSALVQSFLAIRAQRLGDTDAALRHSALALATETENSTLMFHRAEVLLWAALAGNDDSQLPIEGIDLLRQAIAQRLQWDGPTLEMTLHLARACLLTGQFRIAVDACLAPPEGSAQELVAEHPEIKRLALAAASALNRPDLARSVAESMDASYANQLSKHMAGLLDATPEQRRTWLQADLDAAIASDDYARAAYAALELAELGVDTNQSVNGLVERHILSADTPDFISALVTAHSDLDRALPTLRTLARTNRQAGAALVDLLQRVGRLQEALTACESILRIRRGPAGIASRVQLLIRLGDVAAEQAAIEAAKELDGFDIQRQRFLTFAAQKAAERNEWDVAERHLQDVFTIPGPPDPDAAWRLVEAQLHTGHLDHARYTIDKYKPEVRTLAEAECWIAAHADTSLDVAKAGQALMLAEKFNDPKVSTALLSLIVMSTNGIDTGLRTDSAAEGESAEQDEERLEERKRLAMTAVPGELHRQAYEALNRLVKEHGDATGVTILTGDDEDLLNQFIGLLKASAERDRILADYAQKAQNSQLPIGLLASLAGKGYATTIIQRSLGMLPAASADEEEHDLEVQAAAAAINGAAVAEAAALVTASGLQEDPAAYFSTIAITPGTLRDIHRARADIRGAASSPGTFSLDHETETPRFTPLPPEEYIRQLQRAEALTAFATRLPVRLVGSRQVMPELADEPRFAPWLEPLELAHELGYSLWSDDLGLRRAARQAGITAFGTPALLIALNEQRVVAASDEDLDNLLAQAAALTLAMARDRIVDLQFAFGDILRLAEAENWEPAAGALALSRPSWWAWSDMRFQELVPLFTAVHAKRPNAFAQWQISAMIGAGKALLDPAARLRILCFIALLGWDPNHPGTHVRDGVDRARSVASSLGYPDPIGALPDVAATLSGSPAMQGNSALATEILRVTAELTNEKVAAEDPVNTSAAEE